MLLTTMMPRIIATLTLLLLATSCMCDKKNNNNNSASRRQLKESGPTTVDLRSAGAFTVLAKSTVTNTGPTSVGGMLGVSPGTAVTGSPGFPTACSVALTCGLASSDDSAIAVADFQTAYLDAAGRTGAVVKTEVNLGGMTFTAGLYKTVGAFEVSSGTLYLSGPGIFIFQIEKTLMMSTGMQMVLMDGAKASNVFWQVGESAQFKVNSVVVGTVMALDLIAMQTGASVDGRLMSHKAVTLDSNPITFPAVARRQLLASPPTVALGAAEAFCVHASTTVTNTGTTWVSGFLGVSPGTAVTGSPGFPEACSTDASPATCGLATTDYAATAAPDVEIAYNDAASRTGGEILTVVDIAGRTFTAGLYKTSGEIAVTTGAVTLHGSPTDVFIFQIEKTLMMSTGTQMLLTGGAKASNVFWQVAAQAVFLTDSVVVGTVLANKMIAIQTRVSVQGRLFSVLEQVTMDSNVITFPVA